MQSTIGNGERSSASTAYLTPKVRERPNLTILVNTYITRVLPVRTTGHVPDIRTVEVAPRTGGTVPLSVAMRAVA
jgi:choline dehydrogenase